MLLYLDSLIPYNILLKQTKRTVEPLTRTYTDTQEMSFSVKNIIYIVNNNSFCVHGILHFRLLFHIKQCRFINYLLRHSETLFSSAIFNQLFSLSAY